MHYSEMALAWGHTVVGEANVSQHSIQLIMSQIILRGGRGWGGEEEGTVGNLLKECCRVKMIKMGYDSN